MLIVHSKHCRQSNVKENLCKKTYGFYFYTERAQLNTHWVQKNQ